MLETDCFFSIFPADVEGFSKESEHSEKGTFNFIQFSSLCGSCVVLDLRKIGKSRARYPSIELVELVPEEIRILMARNDMVTYGSGVRGDHFPEKGIEVKWLLNSQHIYTDYEKFICKSLGNDGKVPRTSIGQISFVSEKSTDLFKSYSEL